MTLTLLLDLDDTLLDTNMDAFVPAYFQALAKHLKGHVQPESMLPALMSGTQLMLASDDPAHTLQEVFEADFYPKLGIPKEQLGDVIEQFYDEVFPTIGRVTKKREGAAELVDWAFAQGYRVAVATDPLFPRKATLHRIRWAGLEPERFDLVSSFETFHFSKSHPAYFAEVLGRLGWPDSPVLMVGNDVERDLVPAQRLGLATYQIDGVPASRFGPEAARRGNLVDLRLWLESADLALLEPSFKTTDAILAVLASTPGVLAGLSSGLCETAWSYEPKPDDWAMIEILCHLRDTEREIHQMQVKTLLEEVSPFIPRPDAAVWAKQRQYLNENAHLALQEFTASRISILSKLKGLGEDIWSRTARHAIFGPSNFREVVGFIADHDRLHIQQAWNTIKTL
ncbi:MAG: DinB family protein [Chloroflexi bacterium]|nr:DinB family protein [Chloroflexota bacterium]MBI3339502.1 DinB family protein [Chloroflexota bacterium]